MYLHCLSRRVPNLFALDCGLFSRIICLFKYYLFIMYTTITRKKNEIIKVKIIFVLEHLYSLLRHQTLHLIIWLHEVDGKFWLFYLGSHSFLFISGEGNGNPLLYSCLKNPMDRGAWLAAVHRITKSQTGLKRLSTVEPVIIHFSFLSLPLSFSPSCSLSFYLLFPF